MALDPAVKAALDAIDAGLAQADTVHDQLAAQSAQLRKLLDAGPPPPPPPTDTPITIVHPRQTDTTTQTRVDASTVSVPYQLAGSLARCTKIAVAVKGTTGALAWQDFGPPPSLTGTVQVKVPSSAAGAFHFHAWDAKAGTGGAWVISTDCPYPAAFNPPPPPPPPPPPGGSKLGFGVDLAGQPVFTLNGKPTVLLGANASGQHGYWSGGLKAAGHSDSWAPWGWNFLRVFEQFPGGGECDFCPDANNPETTAQIVAEYTSKGIVTMIDLHGFGFGAEITQDTINRAVAWWTSMAPVYRGNDLVICEGCNEPESTSASYNHGATNYDQAFSMMCDRWLAFGRAVIDAIRSTGATNVIVFDDAQAGQGCDDFWNIGYPSTGSAVIAVGRQLVDHDPLRRVAFSVHVYDAFGWANRGEENSQCDANFTGPAGDPLRVARLADYVTRCYRATGVPLIAGEFGWQVGESATSGAGFHWPYTQCGSRTLRAQRALTQAGAALSLSAVEWVGFQLTTNGNNGFDSNGLTACGQDFWNYCQKLRNGPVAMAPMMIPPAETFGVAAYQRPELDDLSAFQLARPQRNTRAAWANTGDGPALLDPR